MKNSIGSLAALAAFATPALAAPLPDPVAADFSHVPVSISDTTPISFDINGDNTPDFYVYGNSGFGLRVAASGSNFLAETTYDSLFFTSHANSSLRVIFTNPTDTPVYLGFSFITGEIGSQTTHAAWVLFNANTTAPVVVGGGWQTIPDAPVLVGTPSPSAIPEPSSFAALVGVAALSGAISSRRRRPATPPAAGTA